MIQVELPFPPSELRHNAHQHWRKRHTAAALYKSVCAIDLRAQGLGKLDTDRLHLSITFHPPDKRRHDLDGLLSRAKWAIDSIADATGVDDYHYTMDLRRGEPVKGGKVVITLMEGE